MGRRAHGTGAEKAAQGVVTDSELFAAITKDLADRGLLPRVHHIKAGSVEIQLLPAEERRNSEQDARVKRTYDEETMYGASS